MPALLLALLISVPAPIAVPDTAKPKVSFGGFVDTYYAYDFGKPAGKDRFYTTQPARHNEFNVNLAYLEARLSGDRVHGRVALQAGTSVQSNYAGEPSLGAISGGTLSRHIQEAYAGILLTRGLWLDGGIFYSHIGQESWATRDNPTYTRSLIADYTPYYSSGLRFVWQATPKLTAQLHVINGWQNISETNDDKAVGVRLEYAVSPQLLLGYSNFLGNELPDSAETHVRFFNQGFAKATLGKTNWWLTVDYGRQGRDSGETADWISGSFIGQLQVTPTAAVNARIERYSDPDQVIITTGLPYGFQAWGGSVGLDIKIADVALWRVEARGFTSTNELWPHEGGPLRKRGGFVVNSIGVSF
jgi:hypothetical protein